MPVFVGIEGKEDGTIVYSARDYQVSAYNTFMNINNNAVKQIIFDYPGNIKFKIIKFDKSGLNGSYDRFCVLVNDKNEQHILSDNKEQL